MTMPEPDGNVSAQSPITGIRKLVILSILLPGALVAGLVVGLLFLLTAITLGGFLVRPNAGMTGLGMVLFYAGLSICAVSGLVGLARAIDSDSEKLGKPRRWRIGILLGLGVLAITPLVGMGVESVRSDSGIFAWALMLFSVGGFATLFFLLVRLFIRRPASDQSL